MSCGSCVETRSRNCLTRDSMSTERRAGKSSICAGLTDDGKRKGESAAVAWLALHPDAAAVVFDDLLADGQAEPRALGLVRQRVAYLLELLEDLGLIGGRDANARVRHAHQQLCRRA